MKIVPNKTTALAGIYVLAFVLIVATYVTGMIIGTSGTISPIDEGFSVFALSNNGNPRESTIYGFLPYWKLDKAKYIQTDKLTDIAYFALRIEKDGHIKKLSSDGTLEPGYNNWKNNEELNALILKSKENGVRVALTIISHDDTTSDIFLDCETCWETFMVDLIEELESKQISDINLDFEYVEFPEEDKVKQYTKFVDFVNVSLDEKYEDSKVTVSTFADSAKKPRITDPDELSKAADQLFIMAYDFHYPQSTRAGPISPITKVDGYTSYDIKLMLKDYLRKIPPNKLILGVPYYGYNWVVESPEPYSKRVEGNDYIGYSISQSYEDIVETALDTNPTVQWDKIAQVPYFTYVSPSTGQHRMVYFENKDSLKIKYNLAKQHKLGGVGIWALGYDGGYQELWKLLHQEFIL